MGSQTSFFQQDLEAAARRTSTCFNYRSITVFDLPANWPDLNPIESPSAHKMIGETKTNNADELNPSFFNISVNSHFCNKLRDSFFQLYLQKHLSVILICFPHRTGSKLHKFRHLEFGETRCFNPQLLKMSSNYKKENIHS